MIFLLSVSGISDTLFTDIIPALIVATKVEMLASWRLLFLFVDFFAFLFFLKKLL